MSILGKFHEISFYSLISTIICMCTGKTTFAVLWGAKLNVTSFSTFFLAFLFWACVLFIPIAIIGAFATKYGDGGEGLLFKSDNIVVIIFAHIAEEILGLFLTPFCNGVQREHNKKLNNGLPILHKVPPKRDYGRYFCIMAEKGGTSHGGLTEKLSPFFHAKKQEVNAYGR